MRPSSKNHPDGGTCGQCHYLPIFGHIPLIWFIDQTTLNYSPVCIQDGTSRLAAGLWPPVELGSTISQLTIWRPQDVLRTSGFGQYDVRIWRCIYLILWTISSVLWTSESDVSLDIRGTSQGRPVWHNIRSLVRIWHLHNITDIPRTSRGRQNTSLTSINWSRDVRIKSHSLTRIWPHSSQPISDIQGTSHGRHLVMSDSDVLQMSGSDILGMSDCDAMSPGHP